MRIVKRLVGAVLVLLVVAVAGFFVFAPAMVEKSRNAVLAHEPYPVSAAAQALHARLVVGDLHADPTLWDRDLTTRGTYGQVDIPRLIEGNVALQVFTAVTKSPAGQNYEANTAETFDNITALAVGQLWPVETWSSLHARAMYQAQKLHRIEEAMDGQFRLIRNRADLEAVLAAKAEGRPMVGGIFGIEGGHALEGDLAHLDALEDAGLRLVGLHHFFDNALGGSLHGTSNAGLTDFGRQVVAEVVARGMVLDLAHSSPEVARDVLEITDIPLVVSHGGIAAHCDVKRNFPDDLMQAVAATGGVIGMGYWDEVTCGDFSPGGVARMIATAIEVVGEDHVALGSDFDGSVTTAFDTSELAALTHALLAEGLSEGQIAKVMGDNMVRVLRARLPEG